MEEVGEEESPAIKLIKEEKARIRRPWSKTLIFKLLGRTIGYNLLATKIKELW